MPKISNNPHLETVVIAGTGSYVPDRILTNDDLARMVDTSDEWIQSRTGIRERRIAADNQATSDLATRAAERALEQAGVRPEELGLLIVATVSPDTFFPATACYVQKNLGATNAVCFDVSAACSGFLYALNIARQFISTESCEAALIVGAEKLSSIVNWSDRNTCVLFGDGAGAAVLKRAASGSGHGVLSSCMGSDGTQTDILVVPGGGSACPITPENAALRLNTIRMAGREVYKYAVTAMRRACEQVMADAGLTAEQIDMVIPHQANIRIIEAITERLGVPPERTFVNLDRYGNTSAAAVAIALDEANRTGAIRRGDHVLLVAFGAGLTWAGAVIRW
ncbi:MAG TPA: beta-ketoacyl-ACP synthase III [Verrucomicrobiales bacterium]|nr:beta-ketoacyl-ACP synthase III [Verrucomicrobiales bacterium]